MNETNTITIDKAIEPEFERVCKRIGLSVSSAINVFARAMVKSNGLTFDLISYEPSNAEDEDEEYIPEYYQFADLPLQTQQALIGAREIAEGKKNVPSYKTVEALIETLTSDEDGELDDWSNYAFEDLPLDTQQAITEGREMIAGTRAAKYRAHSMEELFSMLNSDEDE